MNSTSSASRHCPSSVTALMTALPEAPYQSAQQPSLNLTSSPKCSFKAPTAADFDRGAHMLSDTPVGDPLFSRLSSFWSKLSLRG